MRGGLLFNLAMTKVSVLYKEPECKVKMVIKLKVMQSRIKNKFEFPAGELTILDQCKRSFTVVID